MSQATNSPGDGSTVFEALILDSDQDHSTQLMGVLNAGGMRTRCCGDPQDVLNFISESAPLLLVLDLDCAGDALLPIIESPQLELSEIVLMAADDQPERVQQAMRAGASYFFCKPFSETFMQDFVEDVLRDAQEEADRKAGVKPPTLDQFGLLRGSSAPMHKLYRKIRKVAPSTANILVIGESGCGKELVAQTLHQMSDRCDEAFVAVNCGAVPANLFESELFGHEKGSFSGANRQHTGLFEQAHKGTLFLDEITEMPIELQVKLLRVLETQTIRRVGAESDTDIDVRIIAATNRNPEEAVQEEKLRQDLYFRLAQVPLKLPPLRERGDDATGLAQHFLNVLNEQEGRQVQFTEAAIEVIGQQAWPGNVRELRNAVERAFLLADDHIGPDSLESDSMADDTSMSGDYLRISVGTSLDETEKQLIFATLEANGGNKKQTAEALGISLKTLYNRLNDYDDHEETA